ncbi:hypothetical protein CARUB_v10012526mg [Capsella rubella]|uniref:Uncharacterized protein n=1 Tax=Capsella rubella TaxID=81985 RepID=R0IAH3_9BRAS|nr:hypothetical protein CARUB_v10012526mg [Capsella rubella]
MVDIEILFCLANSSLFQKSLIQERMHDIDCTKIMKISSSYFHLKDVIVIHSFLMSFNHLLGLGVYTLYKQH